MDERHVKWECPMPLMIRSSVLRPGQVQFLDPCSHAAKLVGTELVETIDHHNMTALELTSVKIFFHVQGDTMAGFGIS